MEDTQTRQRVELILAHAKRARQELGQVIVQAAKLRDDLQPEEAQGNEQHADES